MILVHVEVVKNTSNVTVNKRLFHRYIKSRPGYPERLFLLAQSSPRFAQIFGENVHLKVHVIRLMCQLVRTNCYYFYYEKEVTITGISCSEFSYYRASKNDGIAFYIRLFTSLFRYFLITDSPAFFEHNGFRQETGIF